MNVLPLCACAVVTLSRAATFAGHHCEHVAVYMYDDRPLHLVTNAGLPHCLHALECRSSDVQSDPSAIVCVADNSKPDGSL